MTIKIVQQFDLNYMLLIFILVHTIDVIKDNKVISLFCTIQSIIVLVRVKMVKQKNSLPTGLPRRR